MYSRNSRKFIIGAAAATLVAATLSIGLSLPAAAGLFHHQSQSSGSTSAPATAAALPGSNTPNNIAPTPIAAIAPGIAPGSDFMSGANERVNKAKTQLDTARKQLAAAKAMVKAAQAEYTAAQADREALALRTTAQGLANESGLQPGSAPTGDTATNATTPSSPDAAAIAPGAGVAPGTPPQAIPTGNDFGMPDFGGAPQAADPTATGNGTATLR